MKEKALKWIVSILNDHDIPFSICGGLAANFYGSERPLNDIDLFVPENDFNCVVQSGSDYISKPAQHYCEKSEGWDLEYVQFTYENIKIEVGSSKSVRIFDQSSLSWKPLTIDFANTIKADFLGSTLYIMPKAELIMYKSLLARPVDQQDISALTIYV